MCRKETSKVNYCMATFTTHLIVREESTFSCELSRKAPCSDGLSSQPVPDTGLQCHAAAVGWNSQKKLDSGHSPLHVGAHHVALFKTSRFYSSYMVLITSIISIF